MFFSLILPGAIMVLVVGLIAKVYLDRTQSESRITNREFAIASAVLLLLIVPLISWVGFKVAVNNQLTFYENWGGFEVRVNLIKTACKRDGNMKHYYKGDPYLYVWYTTERDSKGNTYSKRHSEIRYHDIPYCSEEWTFTIDTTLGTYEIADRNLPENPNNYRFRKGVSVPGHLPSGIPDFWAAAKRRLDAGDPGPVTKRMEYRNYILASQQTILQRYSDSVESYRALGLLPKYKAELYDFYLCDRVYPVGVPNSRVWQVAVDRFAAALGSTLEGDLHLVIVDANKISDPDNYLGAVVAYLQSKQFGRDALAKNAILVILGTKDGQTVDWARAATGMPMGNEAMLLDIRNQLPKTKLTPEDVLGHPKAIVSGGSKVRLEHTQGALEKVLWGVHAFQRVHMEEHGKGSVGYTYLLQQIEPTAGQRAVILLVVFLASCGVWGFCISYGVPAWRDRHNHW